MTEQTASWVLYGILVIINLKCLYVLKKKKEMNQEVEVKYKRGTIVYIFGILLLPLGVAVLIFMPELLGIEVNFFIHIPLIIPIALILITKEAYGLSEKGVYIKDYHDNNLSKFYTYSETWDWVMVEQATKIKMTFTVPFNSSAFPETETYYSLSFK